MSALLLIGKERSLRLGDDRPSDMKAPDRSGKAANRFAPIDQILTHLDQSDEIRACA